MRYLTFMKTGDAPNSLQPVLVSDGKVEEALPVLFTTSTMTLAHKLMDRWSLQTLLPVKTEEEYYVENQL